MEKENYKKNIVQAKSSYFMSKINNSNDKVKETWNIVNCKLGKSKIPEMISIQINDNGCLYSVPYQKESEEKGSAQDFILLVKNKVYKRIISYLAILKELQPFVTA
nr:unnamed protein product [Callosobruchus analis]